jgi:pimeloyl-ACP methyl ester carboxylesterase
MGGTAVLIAAASARPPVVAVASLSGPASFWPMDATGAVAHIRLPALFMASSSDAGFVDDTRSMFAACSSPRKQLAIEPGAAHGFAMLALPGPNAVLAKWLAQVAPS